MQRNWQKMKHKKSLGSFRSEAWCARKKDQKRKDQQNILWVEKSK
jgi:hypothetical protein